MFTINGEKINSNGSVSEIFNTIKEYLSRENLILISHNGVPLSHDDLYTIMNNNESYDFNAVSIFELEYETILNTVNYLESSISEIEQILTLEKEVNLLSVITDLLNSMEELMVLDQHFDMGVFHDFNIHKISLDILSEYETGNQNYILDILEFECLPKYIKLLTLLKERESNGLPNS
jgi:hypothetical protein